MLTLVIGGARSGKSRFAQCLCASGAQVVYIATAQPTDAEMQRRIARHRSERPAHWLTVEEPLAIADAIAARASGADFILLDCLTLWLSNFSWANRRLSAEDLERESAKEVDRFIAASAASHMVVVANEVGNGIVPESPVGRLFRDLHGFVNQQIARQAGCVYQTVAGIPILIKPAAGGRDTPPAVMQR